MAYAEDVDQGRRSKVKTQQVGAAKGSEKAQQLARVNVADGAWQEFRVRALRGGTTVADYLGTLVTEELARPAPEPPVAAATPTPAPMVAVPPPAREE
ncbi:MAG: hypothetical protein ABR598_08740 [Candidatus Dormibacteria bacterium]